MREAAALAEINKRRASRGGVGRAAKRACRTVNYVLAPHRSRPACAPDDSARSQRC